MTNQWVGRSSFLLALALAAASSQAQIRWVPASGGAWSTGANWFGGTPGGGTGGSDVFIDYAPFTVTGGIGSFTTTLNYVASVRALFSRANLTLQTGTSLTIVNPGSIIQGTLAIEGASVSSPGITITGLLDLSSSHTRIFNASTFTAAGPASMGGTTRMTNGTLNLQGATTLGDGIFQDGIANVAAGATVHKTTGATSFTWNQAFSGGVLAFNNAGTVESSSGTINLTAQGNHSGIFRGNGTGIVQFSSGTHTYSTGASWRSGVSVTGGSHSVGAGQQLNLTGSPAMSAGTLTGTGTISGTGTLEINGGSASLAGTLTNNAGIQLNGIVFAVNTTLTNNGTLRLNSASSWRDGEINNAGLLEKINANDATLNQSWNGGPRALNNSGTVRASAGNLRLLAGGTQSGIFEGTGGVVRFELGTHNLLPGNTFRNGVEFVGSAMSIPQGGTMNIAQNPIFRSGSITGNGTGANIGGAGELQVISNSTQFAGILTNVGSINFDSGAVFMVNSAMNNSGLIRMQTGELRDGIHNNSGTVRKQGAATMIWNRPWNGGPRSVNNSGSIIGEAGLLDIQAGGSHTGSFSTSGGEVRFSGNSHSFQNGSSMTGNIRFVGANMNVPATQTVSVSGVDLSGTSSLTGAGSIGGPGPLNFSGTNSIGGSTLTNNTVWRVLDGPLSMVNATLTNNGTIEMNSTGAVQMRDGILINNGIVTTTAGTGRLGVSWNGGPMRVDNRNQIIAPTGTTITLEASGNHSGTFQTAGTGSISFDGGTHTFLSGSILDGNTITNATMVCNQLVDIFGVSEFRSGLWSGSGIVSGDTWRWNSSGQKNFGGNLKVRANIDHTQGVASFVSNGLTNQGTATIGDGLVWRDGVIVNQGTIQKIAGAGTSIINQLWSGGARSVTNTGRLSAQSGTLSVQAPLTNFSAGTLSGGTYEATGTARLDLPIGTVNTLAARAIFRGNGTINQGATANPILPVDLVVLGGLEFTDGATRAFDDLEIAGDLFIGAGSSITKSVGASPAVLQTGGSVRINGSLTNGVSKSAGNLTGTGTLQSIVSTGGSISPGNPIGTLTGTTAAMTNSTLNVRVKNATAGNFSRLALSGAFQLNAGNTLVADAAPNSTVTAGTTVDVVTAASRTGTFATVPPVADWGVTYGATFVRLTANRTITGPILIEGTIDLNGYDASYTTAPVIAELMQGGVVVETPTITLRPDRTYAVETRRRGTFDLVLRGGTWLRRQLSPALTLTDAGINSLSITLKNGDVNGDNEIGPADFSTVAAAFGTFLGDPGYVASADLNKDDEVGPRDFAILAANFGEFGD